MQTSNRAVPVGRRVLVVALTTLLLGLRPAFAQEVATLRAGEAIDVPGGTISVLGADIGRGKTTRVSLRLRATAGTQRDLLIDLEAFRLLAGGVPRAPEYATTDERIMSSFLVPKDSATDFTRVFSVPDKTDDLVLQVRIDGAVERRRLPKR